MSTPAPARRRAVVEAGHAGDAATARSGLDDGDDTVRAAALGALERCGALTDDELAAALADPSAAVRRRAVEVAARRPDVSLWDVLHDPDPTVVEVAAWACGEHERVTDRVMTRLIELATDEVALVREAAVAAMGAIGDPRGLPSIVAACADVPAVRRRAVLALAPFDGPEVDAAVERALADRDWQVRQAADDLVRASRD